MSLIIENMDMPKHAAMNGADDTMYRSCILVHPDGTAELVVDLEFAYQFNFDHNLKRFSLTKIHTPHGRLIDADRLYDLVEHQYKTAVGNERIVYRDLLDLICDINTVIEAED